MMVRIRSFSLPQHAVTPKWAVLIGGEGQQIGRLGRGREKIFPCLSISPPITKESVCWHKTEETEEEIASWSRHACQQAFHSPHSPFCLQIPHTFLLFHPVQSMNTPYSPPHTLTPFYPPPPPPSAFEYLTLSFSSAPFGSVPRGGVEC